MEPEAGALVTMRVATLTLSQADEFVLTGQMLTQQLELSFEEMLILRIKNQTWRCNLLASSF